MTIRFLPAQCYEVCLDTLATPPSPYGVRSSQAFVTLHEAFGRFHQVTSPKAESFWESPPRGGVQWQLAAKATVRANCGRGINPIYVERWGYVIGDITSSSEKLEWRRRPKRCRPSRVRIMADFGAYAWDECGVANALIDLFPKVPGMRRLDRRLEQIWLRTYDHYEPHGREVDGKWPDFEWERFHAAGVELAMSVKALVDTNAEVFYKKPYEDPDSEIATIGVVTRDHTTD